MTDQVTIINRALIRVAKDRINSIDENTQEAIIANEIWDSCREEVLEEGPWSFAVGRANLALTGNTPTFEYTYEFQLPSDCLRVLELPEVEGDLEYEVEGNKLLTNVSTLKIKYIKNITNTGLFSPSFVKAMYLKLASELATAFRRNETLANKLMQEYENAVDIGLAKDAKQNMKERIIADDLLEERRGL